MVSYIIMGSLLEFRVSVFALVFIFYPLYPGENRLNRKKAETESWPAADPAKENLKDILQEEGK